MKNQNLKIKKEAIIDFILAEYKRLNLAAYRQVKSLNLTECTIKIISNDAFWPYHFELSITDTSRQNGNRPYTLSCNFSTLGVFTMDRVLSRPNRKDLEYYFEKAFDLHQDNSDKNYERQERGIISGWS